jgi:hypothetical protein
VRRDEDGVCVDGGDSLAEPLRSRVAAEVGVGDPAQPGPGRVLGRVVGHRKDGKPEPVDFEYGRRTGALEVRARSDRLDPRGVEVGKRVEKRVLSEIQGVIVGQGDAVDAEVGQCLRRPGRRAEVEDPARHRLAARGDAALEVEQAEVSLADEVDDLRRE